MESTDNNASQLYQDLQNACTLVGNYLFQFAIMENTLNHTIGDAIDIESIQRTIVTANMQLRDKLSLLKTCTNFLLKHEPKKKSYIDTLTKIGERATADRNLLAHNMFYSTPDGKGVRFSTVRAKSKLDWPDIIWTNDDAKTKIEELEQFTETLEKMAADFRQMNRLLKIEDRPKNALAALMFPNPQDLPLPEPPSSDTHQPSPETNDKTD